MTIKLIFSLVSFGFCLMAMGQNAARTGTVEGDGNNSEYVGAGVNNFNHFGQSDKSLVRPNPSEGVFNLAAVNDGDDIRVFDGTGRMVFDEIGSEPKMKIDLSHLEKGVYLLIVRDADKRLISNQRIMIR